MKLLLLLPALLAATCSGSYSATVLSNLGSPVTITSLVKGTGGFIPTASEYGFEFTVAGGDHELETITLSVGVHFGSVPLTVELYSSPAGPDAAAFLTGMSGPAQPANQLAVYSPDLPVTLTDGATYFVRLHVNGSGSSYGIEETTSPAAGSFLMGSSYLRSAGSPWGAGGRASEPLTAISATPVPEPASALSGAAGVYALLLRRRRP